MYRVEGYRQAKVSKSLATTSHIRYLILLHGPRNSTAAYGAFSSLQQIVCRESARMTDDKAVMLYASQCITITAARSSAAWQSRRWCALGSRSILTISHH